MSVSVSLCVGGVCGCVGVTKIKVRARMSDAINDVARAQKGKWLGAESKHTQPKHPNTTLFVALCVCVHEFPPFPRANIQTSKHPTIHTHPNIHTHTFACCPLPFVLLWLVEPGSRHLFRSRSSSTPFIALALGFVWLTKSCQS